MSDVEEFRRLYAEALAEFDTLRGRAPVPLPPWGIPSATTAPHHVHDRPTGRDAEYIPNEMPMRLTDPPYRIVSMEIDPDARLTPNRIPGSHQAHAERMLDALRSREPAPRRTPIALAWGALWLTTSWNLAVIIDHASIITAAATAINMVTLAVCLRIRTRAHALSRPPEQTRPGVYHRGRYLGHGTCARGVCALGHGHDGECTT